eukprot:1994825-Pyramimonas_sp.AAC.2
MLTTAPQKHSVWKSVHGPDSEKAMPVEFQPSGLMMFWMVATVIISSILSRSRTGIGVSSYRSHSTRNTGLTLGVLQIRRSKDSRDDASRLKANCDNNTEYRFV